MRVKFMANLGSRDAARLGLDHFLCQSGAVLDLPEPTVKALGGTVQAAEEHPPKPEAGAVEQAESKSKKK